MPLRIRNSFSFASFLRSGAADSSPGSSLSREIIVRSESDFDVASGFVCVDDADDSVVLVVGPSASQNQLSSSVGALLLDVVGLVLDEAAAFVDVVGAA